MGMYDKDGCLRALFDITNGVPSIAMDDGGCWVRAHAVMGKDGTRVVIVNDKWDTVIAFLMGESGPKLEMYDAKKKTRCAVLEVSKDKTLLTIDDGRNRFGGEVFADEGGAHFGSRDPDNGEFVEFKLIPEGKPLLELLDERGKVQAHLHVVPEGNAPDTPSTQNR